MKKPVPGFYWARMEGTAHPTMVEFSDEGGDQWFTVYSAEDWAIDLKDADEKLTILAPINLPPDA